MEKVIFDSCLQGSHRLRKYLNIQDCLEKSLKIKYALKSTGKILKRPRKVLEFYLTGGFNTLEI